MNLHARSVADLATLADVLRDLLTQPRQCIVRGEPIDAARTMGVRRLVHPDAETGEAPTLGEIARRWVAVDLDSVALPPGTDPRDLAACAGAVRCVLPPAFRGAAAIVTATASHGIKPGARLRWWAWLSRPTTGDELKAWFMGCPVDFSVFGAAQPIYTAAPLFLGRADPLPARLALVPGDRGVVEVPGVILHPRPAPASPAATQGLAFLRCASRGAPAMRFAALLQVVRGAAEGERHPKLLWAALKAHELVQDGSISDASARDALVNAAMDAGGIDRRNAEKTAEYGLKHGPRGDA
ncbi:hypothetical protein Rmf_40120 [Roseomonas fluvialis]|uniref:Uncharacterized protein n=1 Tax=Roseomonas fluvialis TaxID=1750527 RepID=A0ABM7Y7X7_9PROT|nr:hypothetical protein Rmf_40120 [Roseomonas fluvialis]